jgi:hypothetical protein
MKYNTLKKIIFSGLFIGLFFVSSYATTANKTIVKNTVEIKFITKPTSLAAKSFAVKKFGRNINILSNRFSKKSGCYKIVIKTKKGDRETLKICANKVKSQLPLS